MAIKNLDIVEQIENLKKENKRLNFLLKKEGKKSEILKQKLVKQREYFISETDNNFKFIVESTPVPIFISHAVTGEIIYANQTAIDTFYLAKNDLLSSNIKGFYSHELEKEKISAILTRDGYLDKYELQTKKADGTSFWGTLSIRKFNYRGELAWLNVFCDISQRKQIETEYNRFFKLSLDLFCIANFAGYFVQINPAWEKLLGYTKEELTSIPFLEFIHPEDREKTSIEVKKIKAGAKVLRFENRYRCRDGTYCWLLWTALPLEEEGLIYAVAHNITERKEVEEKLRQSKEELRLITDALPVGIAYIDNQRRYRFINRTHEIWFHHRQEDVIGKYVWEVLGEDFYRQEASPQIDRVLAGENVRFETKITFPNGEEKYIDGRLIPEYRQDRQVLGYYCLITDISDRIQAQQTLQQKESFLKLVLDNIPQLIFWKDCHSVFQGCNQLWAQEVGVDNPQQVIGKTESDLHSHNEGIDIYLQTDCKVLETGEAEVYLEYKSEKDKWFDTKKIPIRDPQGNIVGILSTVEDITERKKAEDALSIAEENYRSIFENALEGIFQSTPDGYYININPAMAKIHGYNSPQAMMAKVAKIEQQIYVDSQVCQKFRELLQKQDRVENFEYQVYRQDGKIIWIGENTRAVRDRNGNLLYYEGIVQDITQRKRKEETLRRQIRELRISIDQQKREQEVKSIVESEYFQQLKEDLKNLRS